MGSFVAFNNPIPHLRFGLGSNALKRSGARRPVSGNQTLTVRNLFHAQRAFSRSDHENECYLLPFSSLHSSITLPPCSTHGVFPVKPCGIDVKWPVHTNVKKVARRLDRPFAGGRPVTGRCRDLHIASASAELRSLSHALQSQSQAH